MAILERPASHVIPRVLITVPLEGRPTVLIDARSFEDELALRCWLRRSGDLECLAEALGRLLDDLDAWDTEEAA
jgi:hypothetical protein